MDYSPFQLLFSFLCLSLWFLMLRYRNGKLSKLPPGPKPLPFIGNILQLTDKPHFALTELSKTYGPIMYLKLGSLQTLVVSSSTIAKEIFLKHDLLFSSRIHQDAIRSLDHHIYSVAWMPVSPKWRNLRKISSIQLFTAKRLGATRFLRQKKVNEYLEYLSECCRKGEAVDVGETAFTTSLNLLSNTFFSINLASYNSEASQEFKVIIRRMFDFVGKPNMADFFPILSYFDPLHIKRDTTTSFSKMFEVFDDTIRQRLSSESLLSDAKDDVLQTLLEISKEDGSDLNLIDIKHLLLDVFAAGTDSTSSTLEWVMTELLCNPSKLEKAQTELDEIIGKDVHVQETDIERLPYLKAIVKETMRLHPAFPFLVPHKVVENFEFCKYFVPKDTQVLINVWAIGRDPKDWKNPVEFLPERFLDSDIDIKGRDFELIPFGAGRRICMGMPLAYRMLHLMLASLLHGFKWRLGDGLRKEDVDMDEKFGLTLQKAKPLIAVPLLK